MTATILSSSGEQRGQRSAFTLIEVLVVITIIAILAALLMASMGSMANTRNRTTGMNNMRQVGIAFLGYGNEHNQVIPGRVVDGDASSPKWPAVLAGYASGTYNHNTDYLKDVRTYIAPGYTDVDLNQPNLTQYLVSNSENHTSWVMNGYNDVGAKTVPVEIRLTAFTAATNTILLGIHKRALLHFYMDMDDGDHKNALELAAYETGSNYLFADGSVRFITQTEYGKPSPTGTGIYGDWLWLADKSNPLPP
ncbi:MAG: type II secretion system protein [Opitutaceae bacterium]|nr:type II secretion system protein [Verrucomicrobiales bacterium]